MNTLGQTIQGKSLRDQHTRRQCLAHDKVLTLVHGLESERLSFKYQESSFTFLQRLRTKGQSWNNLGGEKSSTNNTTSSGCSAGGINMNWATGQQICFRFFEAFWAIERLTNLVVGQQSFIRRLCDIPKESTQLFLFVLASNTKLQSPKYFILWPMPKFNTGWLKLVASLEHCKWGNITLHLRINDHLHLDRTLRILWSWHHFVMWNVLPIVEEILRALQQSSWMLLSIHWKVKKKKKIQIFSGSTTQ